MDSDRIKEIQEETAHPNSVSVQQALFKVWNEMAQTDCAALQAKNERLRKLLQEVYDYGQEVYDYGERFGLRDRIKQALEE